MPMFNIVEYKPAEATRPGYGHILHVAQDLCLMLTRPVADKIFKTINSRNMINIPTPEVLCRMRTSAEDQRL